MVGTGSHLVKGVEGLWKVKTDFRAQNKTPQTRFESWDVC